MHHCFFITLLAVNSAGNDPGVDGMASRHHELHSLIIKYFQSKLLPDLISGGLRFSWGHALNHAPSHSRLSMLHTLYAS